METSPSKYSSVFKAAIPLLWRIAAFVVAFIILSGTIGSRIVAGGLVGGDGFQIYGGAGKALLFAIITAGLLVYRRPLVKLERWRYRNLAWFALSGLSFAIAWTGVSHLLAGAHGVVWVVTTHLALLASVALAALGSFGLGSVRRLVAGYRRELLISLALAIVFYGFIIVVYSLWSVLATAVLHSVRWLLGLSGLAVSVLPPRTLLLDKFGIEIAQYCSGIESIALFSGLYAVVGVLDRHRLDTRKFLLAFPAALLVLFALNILRVYLLILAGYYINPHIAFSLFHTYAGMLFFIMYAILFWAVSYKWMLKPQSSLTD